MELIYGISFIIVVLYIWFDTNAFIEWAKLFRLKFLKYAPYEEDCKKGMTPLSYPDFLEYKFPSFPTRMLNCPICFGVWINILSLVFLPFYTLGLNILLSILGYFLFRWIIKKLYE